MPCISTELLEELPEGERRAEQEQIAKNIAAVAYIGTCGLFQFFNTCIYTVCIQAGLTQYAFCFVFGITDTKWFKIIPCLQTASNAQSFVLAMAMYPDVQKKAQAELDTIIGRDRLPDLDDLDSLPYINAMVKETLRWQPVAPVGELLTKTQDRLSVSYVYIGVAHASSQNDEYDGFFIPKGAFGESSRLQRITTQR